MPQVEPIKVLTVDDVPMNVAELSEAVKNLVEIFDDWNQKEADARSRLMMVSAAKDTLSRQIISQIRTDKAAVEAPVEVAAVEAPVEVAAEAAANDVTAETVALTGDESE